MASSATRPSIVFFHADNLGYGEPGCYGGGLLRGADTKRIDAFAREGFQLLNYAPEAQCTPSRSALLTGRHAIRSGTHTVTIGACEGTGLVAWERTLGDIFSEEGYATMCLGKWHVGDGDGRWPTDHGFDEWYGPPHSYDEALWETDPWYVPGRDPVAYMLDGRKGAPPKEAGQLTYELRRNVDEEYKGRAFRFMEENAAAKRPFLLYFNHTMLHIPVVPVKWRNFKLALVEQRSMLDPAPEYGFARCRNLIWDPKETQPIEPRYFHSWTSAHFSRLMKEFDESVKREPLIPAGAPLDFVPERSGG